MGIFAWAIVFVAAGWLVRRWSGERPTAEEIKKEKGWAGAIHAAGSTYLGSMAGSGPVEFDAPPVDGIEPEGEHVARVERGELGEPL